VFGQKEPGSVKAFIVPAVGAERRGEDGKGLKTSAGRAIVYRKLRREPERADSGVKDKRGEAVNSTRLIETH